jgi:dTDP-4-dehydrorhamnose reductase
VIDDIRPDIVLHAAVMGDVNECERDPEAANEVNHLACAVLARALPPETFLVAYSSLAVYPDTDGPHLEGTEAPVNIYGKTKLAGEGAALRHERTIVLRTSLFGPSRTPERHSISDFIISNLKQGTPITLYDDVLFSPLHLRSLAEITLDAVMMNLRGTFNVAARDGMTKADFGLAIAAKFGLSTKCVTLSPLAAMADQAPRGFDTRLDVRRIEKALGRPMPTLKEEIAKL